MKKIQTIADIEELKARNTLPLAYIQVIEMQFVEWYEAEGEGKPYATFQLPNHTCIYHLEDETDTGIIMDQIINVEFVDIEEGEGWKCFRVGLMQDHQMIIIYFLEGTLPRKIEKWLER